MPEHLDIFVTAYFDLDSERCHQFGYQRIPFSKILDYAKYYDFDKEHTEDLIFFIQNIDFHKNEKFNKEMNKESKKVSKK